MYDFDKEVSFYVKIDKNKFIIQKGKIKLVSICNGEEEYKIIGYNNSIYYIKPKDIIKENIKDNFNKIEDIE